MSFKEVCLGGRPKESVFWDELASLLAAVTSNISIDASLERMLSGWGRIALKTVENHFEGMHDMCDNWKVSTTLKVIMNPTH